MHHDRRKCTEKLDDIISVRYGIHTVSGWCIKAEKLCSIGTIQRISGSCQCSRSKRTGIHSLTDIKKSVTVSAEHLKICAYMVCQSYRLCLLKVGKSRHVGVNILFHDLLQGKKKVLQLLICLIDLVADIKLHIQSYLVITASSCVKLLSGISNTVDQVCLHEAVDILILCCDLQLACFHVCKDSVQSFCDLLLFFLCQDSLFCKHGNMCLASTDILSVKFLIKGNGCVKIVNQLVRFFCKTASP